MLLLLLFSRLEEGGAGMGSNIVSNIVCVRGGGNQPFSSGHNNLELSIAHPSAVAGVQSIGSDRKQDRSFVLSQIFIENLSCARSYFKSCSRLWRYL